jgi:hypothetical protein
MPEYSVMLTIELRLSGEFLLEAASLEDARTTAEALLTRLDLDYTVYEGGVQSDDIFWEQDDFNVGIQEIHEVLENGDDEEHPPF